MVLHSTHVLQRTCYMPGTMEALGYHSAQSSLCSHAADEQAYQVRWDRHQPMCRCWEENKAGGGGEAQSTVGGGRVLWSRGSERKDFLRGRSLSRDHVTFRAVNASRLSAIVILSATGTGRGVGTARWRRTCTSLHSTTSGTGRGYLLSG